MLEGFIDWMAEVMPFSMQARELPEVDWASVFRESDYSKSFAQGLEDYHKLKPTPTRSQMLQYLAFGKGVICTLFEIKWVPKFD